jgi:mRNA interferase YafQ
MLKLVYSNQFKKDFKKLVKSSIENVVLTGGVITKLQENSILPKKCVDHPLSGNWGGFRDCHIKPDLVLIYRIQEGELQLARIGTHSELF